jgi:hypothetical protein
MEVDGGAAGGSGEGEGARDEAYAPVYRSLYLLLAALQDEEVRGCWELHCLAGCPEASDPAAGKPPPAALTCLAALWRAPAARGRAGQPAGTRG